MLVRFANQAPVQLALTTLLTTISAEQNGLMSFLPFAGAFNGIKNLFVPPSIRQPAPMARGDGLNGLLGIPQMPEEISETADRQGATVDASSKCQTLTGPIAAMLMSTCESTAATKTGLIWGSKLKQLFNQPSPEDVGNGLTTGLKETCEQLAQKQACDQLGANLAKCDVTGAIAAFIGHAQARERCKKLSSFFVQNNDLKKSIGGLVGNEFVGGLMQQFLG